MRNGSRSSDSRNGSRPAESRNGSPTSPSRFLEPGDPCPVVVEWRDGRGRDRYGVRERVALEAPEPCGLPVTIRPTWRHGRIVVCVDPIRAGEWWYDHTHELRQCARCFGVIPRRARADARYCSTRCRVAAHRAVTAVAGQDEA